MSTPSSSLIKPASTHSPAHLRVVSAVCPFCEQPIPHERFDEIKERIETRERERLAEITTRLQTQFAREKTEALEQAQMEATAVLVQEREKAANREAAARVEGRQAVEIAAQETLAAAKQAHQEAQAAMQARIEQAESTRIAAEQSWMALQVELDQTRRDNEVAIEKVQQDALAKEEAIRSEARQVAEAAVHEKLADMERDRQESDAMFRMRIEHTDQARIAAQEAGIALKAQLDQMHHDNEAALEMMKQEAAARETLIRQEAINSTQAAMQEKLAKAEQAKVEADIQTAAAQQQILSLQNTHATQLAERLQEQREALERAQSAVINAEKSAAFEEKMKLSAKVEDLQRTLDKKTAEELGEGAEINLYEVLKKEFEGDRIERINRGQPGADIRHVVINNGKECGTIIYDSKNHNAWRNDFVTKLATDQMAAKAEHAILSTVNFQLAHVIFMCRMG